MTRTGALPVVILTASIAVAGFLAFQAVTASRQRQAVSEAMLRQYAELARWEFSRQARRDVDEMLTHALASYAHPGHAKRPPESSCQCGTLTTVDRWFEAPDEPDAAPGPSESIIRIAPLEGDPTRFVASKPEPHLPAGSGRVGLVAPLSALAPVLSRALEKAALLPATIAAGRDDGTLVDLRVFTGAGTEVLSPAPTRPGPYVVEGPLSEVGLPLTVRASMTRTFIDGLGPEHGAGPGVPMIAALMTLNIVLVGAGLRLVARERELARLRSGFVAGVSHELRTPLAQIRMFSETLLLDRVRDDAERTRALEIISQESQRLSHLVDNVLVHDRPIPIGREGLARIDIGSLVRQVAESFEPLAAARNVALAVHDLSGGTAVAGHAGALRQVILNLLDNAVKFGPPDQTVTVSVAASGEHVVISVEDEGPGVPAADYERIFRPFERGRDTGGTGGAGIGLSVVEQVIAAHGGKASVERAAGGGARFSVRLPLARAAVS